MDIKREAFELWWKNRQLSDPKLPEEHKETAYQTWLAGWIWAKSTYDEFDRFPR
jgi:hypothetical protein